MLEKNAIIDDLALEFQVSSSDIFLVCKQGCAYPYLYATDSSLFFELTGFKASAGLCVISKNTTALFLDARYTLAAEKKFQNTPVEIIKASIENLVCWIKRACSKKSLILFDDRVFTVTELATIEEKLKNFQIRAYPLDNFRKKSKKNAVILRTPDKQNVEILAPVQKLIRENKIDAYLISDPATISWLLGIRDISKHTCALLAYAIYTKKGILEIYPDASYKNIKEISKALADKITDTEKLEGKMHEEPSAPNSSKNIKEFSKQLDNKTTEVVLKDCIQSELQRFNVIGADFFELPAFLYSRKFANFKNPFQPLKAQKTAAQIQNIKKATNADSLAIIKFMYWFYNIDTEISELDAAQKILEIRALNSDFISESFDCIAAADAHSAIIHYTPSEESNKKIENILLLDSGGQYKYATTDITRTLLAPWHTDAFDIKKAKYVYTLVLKSSIALATAKSKTARGVDFSQISRAALGNLDCPHSIGHGIGYMLNVHEGPFAISNSELAIPKSVVLSNEPGFYVKDEFGVRLENMIISKRENDETFFETISFIPFDINLIAPELLDEKEMNWLEAYHEELFKKMSPGLSYDEKKWLQEYLRLT